MKANELRIGNWIMKEGELFQVTSYTFLIVERDPDQFDHIHLTDEWLVRHGGEIRPLLKGILLDRFWFIWKGSYNYWYVLDARNQTYLTKIEFVHELQNFYKAMNGQEITIMDL